MGVRPVLVGWEPRSPVRLSDEHIVVTWYDDDGSVHMTPYVPIVESQQ